MSEIKAGDMVRLVWACCAGGRKYLGWVGTVESVVQCDQSLCFCGYITHGIHAWIDIQGRGVVPLSWLMKIDPPAIDESVERDAEVTA